MSSYEFWDELGKIFNAVVAYQEKNLEFNKRFISPWIRLGNVFEKQDRNKEAMNAYERAIEIDGGNPQNWFELGNIHFKMENYAEAVSAFNRAIELDPSFGWAHNNLALTLASMGEIEQAVALYQKAIELLQDAKDKAVGLESAGQRLSQAEPVRAGAGGVPQGGRAGPRERRLPGQHGRGHGRADAGGSGHWMRSPASRADTVSVSPIELIVADSRGRSKRPSLTRGTEVPDC